MTDRKKGEKREKKSKGRSGGAMVYEVLIVTRSDRDAGRATIEPGGFSSDDAEVVKHWAEVFNDRELLRPRGAWAVVAPRNIRATKRRKSA